MKSLYHVLIYVCFFTVNPAISQIEHQIFRDGLYLATALGSEKFDLLELYFKEKNYKYDDHISEDGSIAYTKFSENGESATTIIIHVGQNGHKVSFIFAGSELAFLSRKLKSIAERNKYIKPVKNGYSIYFPNSNSRNDDESDIGYVTFFYLKENYISFETPYHIVNFIDWESFFLDLPDDFF